MAYPVMDPNVAQFVHGSAGINPAAPPPMSWSMCPQDGTVPSTAGPTANVPFPQTIAMDDTVNQRAAGLYTSQQSGTTSTSVVTGLPATLQTLSPAITAEAMKAQLSSRIGTPGGSASDHWNEWVQFEHPE